VLLSIVELIVGDAEGEGEVGFWVCWEDSALGYFIPLVVRVVYFEAELIEGVRLKSEDKILDDCAFRFNIVILIASVLKGESDGGAGGVDVGH
jgi:hypothetical protein